MDKVEVVKLDPESWRDYKNLRLTALKDDPEAFGLIHHQEFAKRSDEEWRDLLVQSAKGTDKLILFAKFNDELVGMLTGKILNDRNRNDLGDTVKVGEVFVISKVRGKGVGKKLLAQLLEEFKKNPQVKKFKVKVFTSQLAAISLYKSAGFIIKEKITEEWPDGRTNETFVMTKDVD